MKELSIEEKAKAYDRVSKEVKDFFEGRQKMYSDVSQTLKYLFPELKKCEDEKIRKVLVELVKCNERCGYFMINNTTTSAMLAWLEKQGEQKPFDYENAYIQQKDFAPKETVKEAESNLTPLERKVKDILFSFHVNADDGISFDGTMAIVHNLITLCQQEQKPTWSEEDEKMVVNLVDYFKVDDALQYTEKQVVDWLKSLKGRVQPQPKQEWSEEDQNALEDVREAVVHYWGGDSQDILLYWLKSIKQKIKGE